MTIPPEQRHVVHLDSSGAADLPTTLSVKEIAHERASMQIGKHAMRALSSALGYVGSPRGFRIIQPNDYHPMFGVTQDETVDLHQALSDVFGTVWQGHPDFDYDRVVRRQLGKLRPASKGYLWNDPTRRADSSVTVEIIDANWANVSAGVFALEALKYAMWYFSTTYGPRTIEPDRFLYVLGVPFEEFESIRSEFEQASRSMYQRWLLENGLKNIP